MCVDNKVRETIGDVYCPKCRNEKCVYLSTNKATSFYDCEKCKACCHVLNIPFKDQKPTIMLFRGDGTHCFARKTSRDYEKEKPSPFSKKFLRQSQPSTSEREPKGINQVQTRNKYIRLLLADDLTNIFNFQVFLFNFTIQSTATQLTFNLEKIMIFSVSNDGIQWTVDFGPGSVTIAVNDLDQNITISSQEIPSSSLAIALVSKRRLFEHSSSASSNYSQSRGNDGDERRSTLQCGGSRLGHKQLSSIRSRGYRAQLGKFTIGP